MSEDLSLRSISLLHSCRAILHIAALCESDITSRQREVYCSHIVAIDLLVGEIASYLNARKRRREIALNGASDTHTPCERPRRLLPYARRGVDSL